MPGFPFNRRLAVGVLAIGVAAVASAAPADPLTLDISYSVAAYRPLMERTAKAFETANPGVTITLRPPAASHEEHLAQTLRAEIAGDVADVAFHGNHLVATLVERKIAQPIDALIAAEPDFAQLGYAAGARAVAGFGGRTFGLAWQISAPVIFYNADLVRKAGGDPERLPETWDGILDLARRIKASNPNVQGGFFDYLTNGNWTFQVLVAAAGGALASPDDRAVAFGGAEGLGALRVIRAFGEAGMVDMTQAQSQQAFGAGVIGVYAGYNSTLAQFERAAQGKFQVKVGPWPVTAANGTVPAGGRTAVIQAKAKDKQAAAWRYLIYMTGPEVQAEVARSLGAVPGNLRALDLLASHYSANPNARIGVEMLPKFARWYAFPGENTVKIVDVIRDHLREVATLRRSPEDALPLMVKEVEALMPPKAQ